MLKLIFIGLFLATLANFAQAKLDCSYYQQKLKLTQNKLRAGYNVKQGEKLKKQEKQLRRLWWLCTNNRLTKDELKRLKKRNSSKKIN